MKIIEGAYISAQIFTTDNKATAIDQYAILQLQMIIIIVMMEVVYQLQLELNQVLIHYLV